MIHDIGDIIANCASTHWADRKDGLIGLQGYFRDGRMLTGSELRRVTEIFGRMFMDAHTKVFTLFLDTLIELVVTHKADLCDWLHILLTRLLNKLGGDLLGSIITKINRTLDIVRDAFTYGEQMTVLMRFLGDQALTPNTKVKIATVKHLSAVAQLMEPAQVKIGLMLTGPEQEMALAKVITWTYEPKSAEVRRQSQAALVALFQLNATHFTQILLKLPKVLQENAAGFVTPQTMTESTATLTPDEDPIPDAALPMKPRQSPNSFSQLPPRKSPFKSNFDPVDDSENLNPEEVHKSLRSTANAIQNYTFDSGADSAITKGESSSSASSLSKGGTEESSDLPEGVKEATDLLEKQMASLNLSSDAVHKQNIENLARGTFFSLVFFFRIKHLQTFSGSNRSLPRNVRPFQRLLRPGKR